MTKKQRNQKNKELALHIPTLIGGKSNISYFSHCITRLRFSLKDKGLVKFEDIIKLDGVIGCQWAGEQLQIIIGQNVGDVYQMMCNELGFAEQDAINENLDIEKNKKLSFNKILDIITGCITPLIPVLIGAGLIKTLILIGDTLGILSSSSSTYYVLSFVADSGFYFLPVMAGAYAAKKFGANMAIGMLMGAMLIHPSFINSITQGDALAVFGLPIYSTSYSSTIIPVILIVAVMAPIERFIGKHCPQVLRAMLQPVLTILIMIPLSLCLLAPIGSYIGLFLAEIFIWLYNTFGFLGIAVVAAVWPFLIMTGMHQALSPYALNSFATLGYEPIVITSSIIHNFSQAGACAAVALKSKIADIKAVAVSCSTSAIIGGVSEPAVYGISLKYKTPLYCSMIANFIAGAVIGINHVYAMVLGGGAILGLPVFVSADPSNLIWAVIACIIATIVAFILTLIFYKDSKEGEIKS